MTNDKIMNKLLTWNNIGDKGAIKIGESLMINTSLTKLYLSSYGGMKNVGERYGK